MLRSEFDDGARCSVCLAENGRSALEQAVCLMPDVLVIDALLPYMDGLGVLDCLRARLGGCMPRVIGGAVTPFCDAEFRRRGAAAVLRVPWEYEQLRAAVLREISALNVQIDWHAYEADCARASALLAEMGMSASLKGFAYLSCAAALACRREERLKAVGSRLYAPVAGRFGVSRANVERLIRHAIERTMDSAQPGGIYDFFGNTIDPTRGKPTNAQVIALLAQRMRTAGGSFDCGDSD